MFPWGFFIQYRILLGSTFFDTTTVECFPSELFSRLSNVECLQSELYFRLSNDK